MRVAIIAPSPVPFVVGGAEKLWWGMQRYLNENTTHSCELLKIPIKEDNVVDLLRAYYKFFTLDLSSYDRVISTKYPAFMARHPEHHLYLQHLLRGCYDTYPLQLSIDPPFANTNLQRLLRTINGYAISLKDIFSELFLFAEKYPDDPDFYQFPGPAIRSILHVLDRRGMEGIKQFSAISQTVKNRFEYFPPAARVTVIHHPSNLITLTPAEQNYLFTVSRLDSPKRIDLLIKSYKKSNCKLPFFIAGTGPQKNSLERLAAGDSKIKFLGFVSDKELERYYANAAAVLYAPYDEDYGLITIEALNCGKPVVTCTDSGGVTEFVKDGVNGHVASPEVSALAAAIDKIPQLLDDKTVANCQASIKDISWKRLMSYLVDDKSISLPSVKRKQLLVVSTYPVYPAQAGGQLRLFHLLKRLACRHTVTLLSLGGKHGRKKQITPYFTEYVIPRNEEFSELKNNIEERLGISADDFAFMCHEQVISEFSAQFLKHSASVDMVVCAQPYVYPLVSRLYAGDVVYDSQNVEYLLKSSMVRSQADDLLQLLFVTEQRLCREASLMIACAQEDIEGFKNTYGGDFSNCNLLPNGVDIASTPFLTSAQKNQYKNILGLRGKIAIFIGSAHQPNVEAVKVILTLAQKLPKINFLVIGSVSHKIIENDDDLLEGVMNIPENVGLTGAVGHDEKSIYLQIADIALNPMMSGSGSNLKLAEYLAAGIPVVSTVIGSRGYRNDVVSNIDIVEVEEFSGQIIKRLDNLLPSKLSTARDKVARHYSWDSIARKLPF